MPYEEALAPRLKLAQEKLQKGSGAGGEFTGWVHLPRDYDKEEFARIQAAAAKIRQDSKALVVIGIGGSYLGARGVIDCLCSPNYNLKKKDGPNVYFIGNGLSADALQETLDLVADVDFSVNVISKSGTTTEPAIAFRILREQLEKAVGRQAAAERIIAITDAHRGALRKLATDEGYKTFVIEDNVGGRFSVLTPVGLVPVAVAGFDIHALVKGARDMQRQTADPTPDNIALTYAATRNVLYRSGKHTEILVNYNPRLHFVAEWWKQLYGESEGKNNRGIFPAAVDNSTDLHSMGQWIQEGERTIFETVISVDKVKHDVVIPTDSDNLDALNYLAGKHVDEVNKMAELGTRLAHVDGGVPNIRITIPEVDEYNLGQLLYFFEKACGISGYLLGVNPFNQPGVEAYKRNMFALLSKPGYEKETEAIRARL